LKFTYSSVEAYTEFVDLKAGKEYDFAVEKDNPTSGAFRVLLNWKTPEIFEKEKIVEKESTNQESIFACR